MIQHGFLSSSECLELEACLRRQREDHGTARRANAVLLLAMGRAAPGSQSFFMCAMTPPGAGICPIGKMA